MRHHKNKFEWLYPCRSNKCFSLNITLLYEVYARKFSNIHDLWCILQIQQQTKQLTMMNCKKILFLLSYLIPYCCLWSANEACQRVSQDAKGKCCLRALFIQFLDGQSCINSYITLYQVINVAHLSSSRGLHIQLYVFPDMILSPIWYSRGLTCNNSHINPDWIRPQISLFFCIHALNRKFVAHSFIIVD